MKNFRLFSLVATLTIVAAVLLTALWPGAEAAPSPAACDSSYEAAVAAIQDARLGLGLERKLLTKVDNAWRVYKSGLKNSQNNAGKQLESVLRLLDSPATKQIPAASREKIRKAIQNFLACLSGAPPVDTATLTVRTFLPSDVAVDGRGDPAGAGVIIKIGGLEFGVTGADGTATLQVPAGTLQVTAVRYPSNMGEGEITLAAGETGQLNIIVDEGKEAAEATDVVLDEAPDGMLNRNFTTFTLRFLNDETTVQLQKLVEIELIDPLGGAPTFIENMFALQTDGRIITTNINGLRSLLLSRSGAIEIRVLAFDSQGRTHNNKVRFYVSSFRVVGTLQAPPSFPGLNRAGINVTAAILNTDLVFHAVSDSAGTFEFPLLPTGNMEFRSETFQNQKYYYGQGIVVLNGNKSLAVNMLHTEDLINRVPEFSVSTLFSSSPSSSAQAGTSESGGSEDAIDPEVQQARMTAESLRLQAESSGESASPGAEESSGPSAIAAATSDTASINVVAGSQNVPMSQTATLNVTQGTTTVTLTYTVATAEYPYYVLSQSIYNDTWSLVVRAGSAGQQDFYNARQINSQLSGEPVWQSNGTTGTIKEVLDVESLAANADTTLTVYATAMNVGDSILPTSVNASLSPQEGVSINSITPDRVPRTTGDSSYYSLPRSGQNNTLHRNFTLNITKPSNSTVKNVKVDVYRDDGGHVETVINSEAPGTNVTVVNATTIRVRVTGNASAAPNDPTTHEIKYRFKVVVTKQDGTDVDAERDSGIRHALWRMPDGFGRYSTRDAGGDDWCARFTFYWMRDNRNLLGRINDISGEHARDIGHATHETGADIDMYHYYTFPNAGTGEDNYLRLRADVLLLPNLSSQDQATRERAEAARARILDWMAATRNGLNNLAAMNSVSTLYYAIGDAGSGLPEGWARNMLQSGTTTVNGQNVTVGAGPWSNAKVRFNSIHNSHVHIALNRAMVR